MGAPTKETRTTKSRNSKTMVDNSISKPKVKTDVEQRKYYCQSCGKVFLKQKDNFPTTQSPMFEGNNGFTNMCKSCTDKWYYYHVEVFCDNEEKAMDRMASLFDWYYSDEIMATTRKISSDRSRIFAYPSKMNLQQYNPRKDKSKVTYLDTIADRSNETINSLEQLKELKENDEISVSERTVKKWGVGFSDTEYEMLNSQYKMLTQQIETLDFVQETLIRDLCVIKIQQMRAMQKDDVDKYDKLTKLYQQTLSSAKLKPNELVQNDTDENPFDLWINDIEKYTPADYYADKNIYRDFFGIGEYCERHIFRPLKNFFVGTKERDVEFNIDDGGQDA